MKWYQYRRPVNIAKYLYHREHFTTSCVYGIYRYPSFAVRIIFILNGMRLGASPD